MIRTFGHTHPSDNRPGCRARSARFAAAPAFAHGELAEEVFVDAPKGVVVEADGDLGDFLQQFLEQGAGEKVVGLGQDAGELRATLRFQSISGNARGKMFQIDSPVAASWK